MPGLKIPVRALICEPGPPFTGTPIRCRDSGYHQPHLVVPQHTHFLQKGWICRNTNCLPEWIPPRWIDQDQTPQLNTRIRRLHA